MKIPAKPWLYDGYPFRSKLEARWYATFKLMGYQIDYEPEQFVVEEICGYWDRNYLPDFKIGDRYVEIKPLLDEYDEQQTLSVWNAMILGYSVPTIVIFGTPREFYAIECSERYKGSPLGSYLDSSLRHFEEMYLCGSYPDEAVASKMFGNSLPLKDMFCYKNKSQYAEQAEKMIQWKPTYN